MISDGDIKRFWPRVKKTSSCWLWTGGQYKRGTKDARGGFSLRGRTRPAHRVAWEIANNRSVPEGMFVCHKCDNTLCVRPSHLFIGTPLDNVRDMIVKGRRASFYLPPRLGMKHHKAKLSDADVKAIIVARNDGESKKSIARRYGVYDSTIRDILKGKTWSQLTGIVAHQ